MASQLGVALSSPFEALELDSSIAKEASGTYRIRTVLACV